MFSGMMVVSVTVVPSGATPVVPPCTLVFPSCTSFSAAGSLGGRSCGLVMRGHSCDLTTLDIHSCDLAVCGGIIFSVIMGLLYCNPWRLIIGIAIRYIVFLGAITHSYGSLGSIISGAVVQIGDRHAGPVTKCDGLVFLFPDDHILHTLEY
jgi:hypothetical protein